MSAFEFFFSLFGLILGLAMANVAAGASDILRDRTRTKVGWLTPFLVLFLLMDLTSFWIVSYTNMQGIRVNFPTMLGAVALAVTYFFSAAVVFPKKLEEWPSLDDYYMAHYRWVIGGVFVANVGLLLLISIVSERLGFAEWWIAASQRWMNWFYFSFLFVLLAFRNRAVHLVVYAFVTGSYILVLIFNPALTQ
jgi:hypothetical protein